MIRNTLFCLLLLAGSTAMAQTNTLAVDGTATLDLTNDKVTIDFIFSTTKTSVSAAVSTNSVLSSNITTALTTFGISSGDISTSAYDVAQDATTLDWTVSQTITVIQTDDILNSIDTLLNDVLPLGNVTFDITMSQGDNEDAYDTALVAAVQSAKTRATLIATEGGLTLGDILSVRVYTGDLQVGEIAAIPLSSSSSSGAAALKASPSSTSGSTIKVRVIYEISASTD